MILMHWPIDDNLESGEEAHRAGKEEKKKRVIPPIG